jgi:hypothetical protein
VQPMAHSNASFVASSPIPMSDPMNNI